MNMSQWEIKKDAEDISANILELFNNIKILYKDYIEYETNTMIALPTPISPYKILISCRKDGKGGSLLQLRVYDDELYRVDYGFTTISVFRFYLKMALYELLLEHFKIYSDIMDELYQYDLMESDYASITNALFNSKLQEIDDYIKHSVRK